MKQAQELEKLLNLLQKGIISSEEFDIQKAALTQRYESMPSGPIIGFLPAYKSYWQKMFRWRGRSTRAEYWWPVLGNMIIGYAVAIAFTLINKAPSENFIVALSKIQQNSMGYLLFSLIWGIANFIAGLALMTRRGHDFGKKAWWSLHPLVCTICLSIFMALFAVIGYVVDYATRDNPMGWFKTLRSVVYIIGGFGLIGFGLKTLIWTIIIGFTPGQKFPNIYGDPK